MEAHLCRLVALLELGDPSFPVELGTFTQMAERAAIPRYLYLARSRQATVASLTGPLETADQLIDEAAAYGKRIGEPDTWAVQASQLAGLAYIRHDWTRLSKLAAARGQALTPPEFTLHMRGWLHLEAGDRAAAAALVASIPDWPTTYRWRHTAMMASNAELAAAVGDRHRCAARYEQLLPMAGEFAVVGAAVFTTGPVSLQLGLLAAALGRWDNAAAHLDDAARRCDRLGAALLAARARTELARVRAETAGDGGGNMFRRDAGTWTLAFGGRSVPLRDAKGLRDLAVLLAAQGRDVAATELIAGVTTAAAAGLAGLGADPVLDDRARAAYRTRLARLDEERAEADTHHDIERSAGRDRAVEHLTIVRPDLTPSGQGKEILMAIDEQKMEEAVGKVFGELAVAVTKPLVVLGDRLGLWAALAEAGPMTPNELASRTGTVERYVREWLRGWPWPGISATTRRPARSASRSPTRPRSRPAPARVTTWSASPIPCTTSATRWPPPPTPARPWRPYARVGHAISTMVCTPSSLAQPGAAALGAMAGETRIRQVLADAGCTRVRRVAAEAAPFNIVLEARP